jgi:hypothetical protein
VLTSLRGGNTAIMDANKQSDYTCTNKDSDWHHIFPLSHLSTLTSNELYGSYAAFQGRL